MNDMGGRMNEKLAAEGRTGRAAARLGVALACLVLATVASAGRPAADPAHSAAWRRLGAGNERYRARNPIFPPVEETGGGMTRSRRPFAVVVACPDAGVTPEEIFDQGPGDLLVIMSAGPVIDAAVTEGVEHAVRDLGVGLVVVLGHRRCGAVAAVPGGSETSAAQGAAGRLEAAIRKNILAGVAGIASAGPIIAPRVQAGRITILGAWFDPGTGRVAVVEAEPSGPGKAAAPDLPEVATEPAPSATVAAAMAATAAPSATGPAAPVVPPVVALAPESGTPRGLAAAWTEQLTWGGDIRLRYDQIHYTRTWQGGVDRERLQERLRLRLEAVLGAGLKGKVQLATSTPQGLTGYGSATSANRTLDGLSMPAPVYFDKAFITYEPVREISLRGGRMENPFWAPAGTELVWTGDFTPEGLAQQAAWFPKEGTRVWATAMQMVADEDAANPTATDQWMFGYQLGLEAGLPGAIRLKAAGAFLDWTDPRSGSYGSNQTQDGNVRTGSDSSGTGFSDGVRVNEFGVAVADLEVCWSGGALPLTGFGTYVNNTRARASRSAQFRRGAEGTGWQAGLVAGKAAKPMTAEAGFLYKRLASESTFADVAENNFGDRGGLNRKAAIAWVAFAPARGFVARVRYAFNTRLVNPDLTKSPNGKNRGKDLNRLTAECALSF